MVKLDSNENYSNRFTGILIAATVVAIFIAFTFGVVCMNDFSDECNQPNKGELSYTQKKNDLISSSSHNQENDNLVSEAQKGCNIPGIDTEPGKVQVIDSSLDPNYELPLCIDEQSDLDGLNAALSYKLRVVGGYQPQNNSFVELWQVARFWWDPMVIKGTLKVEWIEEKDTSMCSAWFYTAVIKFEGDGMIGLVSSQAPDVWPSCMQLSEVDFCDEKEVDFVFSINFKGCHFILKGCDIKDIETEPGKVYLVSSSLDPNYELPLCIDEQSDLDGLNAALNYQLKIVGGYRPFMSVFELRQVKRFGCDPVVLKGELSISWSEYKDPSHCSTWYYTAYVAYCGTPINLISSQIPDEIPDCMEFDEVAFPDTVKEVDMKFNSKFEGCYFRLIPTSNLHFSRLRFPTPDIKSPVFVINWINFQDLLDNRP